VLLLIQDGSHLGFGFRQLSDERVSRLVRFFWAEGLFSLCDAIFGTKMVTYGHLSQELSKTK
jgi:hypothetical protein